MNGHKKFFAQPHVTEAIKSIIGFCKLMNDALREVDNIKVATLNLEVCLHIKELE